MSFKPGDRVVYKGGAADMPKRAEGVVVLQNGDAVKVDFGPPTGKKTVPENDLELAGDYEDEG